MVLGNAISTGIFWDMSFRFQESACPNLYLLKNFNSPVTEVLTNRSSKKELLRGIENPVKHLRWSYNENS